MVGSKQGIIFKKHSFLGLSISVFDKEELVSYIIETVKSNRKSIMYGHALWTFPMLKKYPEIFYFGEKSDVLVTDGRPFYIMAKMHGIPLKYDISIPNLVLLSLELANSNNWSVFLLGATDEINKVAQQKISKGYKNISLVAGRDGYFDQEKDAKQIIKQINQCRPSILLIGIPSPTKEEIAYLWKDDLETNIIIPCGGMIDVLAGKTKLTPKMIKKLGLASFYRVLQEPRRLLKRYSYIYGYLFFKFLPIYIFKVILLRNKEFSFTDSIKYPKKK